MSIPLREEPAKNIIPGDIQELRKALARIKTVEEQTLDLISRLKKK